MISSSENTNKSSLKKWLRIFNFIFLPDIFSIHNLLMKKLSLILLPILALNYGSIRSQDKTTWTVKYLDEYIIPADFEFENTKVGGLSDLDFDGNHFYAVCDVPSSPRIYKFKLQIEDYKIIGASFLEVIQIDPEQIFPNDSTQIPFWDSEGLVYDRDRDVFIISSEGSIQSLKNPYVAEINPDGKLLDTYYLPEYFEADAKRGLRDNGVFEGLTESFDQTAIWVSTELPMERDGGTSRLYKTNSPIRITLFDKTDKHPQKQFIYLLDRIRKIPLLPFAWHGVSAILNYDEGKFIFLERTFSAGHGNKAHRIRLFEVDAKNATNTLEIHKLKGKINRQVVPAEKKLLFDFKEVKHKLSHKLIDNIEGISFGPQLPNGNQSLILISDNNFSSWTSQLNQIILLELIPNEK